MAAKNILHYGLNRSGTNYLKEILSKHFDLNFLNNDERSGPLHKHFRLYDNKKLIGRPNFYNDKLFRSFQQFEQEALQGVRLDLVVVISKDPYSWHLSYTKWGKKNGWPPSPHPYIKEYNEFYRKWLQFSEESSRVLMVKYIDLLSDPADFLEKTGQRFDLPLIQEIKTRIRIKKVPVSRRFTPKREEYYLNGKYLEEFSPPELEELNNNIDHELIKKLGYTSHY